MSDGHEQSLLVVVSGPSGAGKSSICGRLLADFDHFAVSVSTTTRKPRLGEEDGVAYHFVEQSDFERQRDGGSFVEWAEVHGNMYGTSKKVVEEALSSGSSLLFDIDYQGAESLKAAFPEAVLIMLLPPDMQTLQARLEGRGTDAKEVIRRRIENAADEIAHVDLFDYVLINDVLDDTYHYVRSIIFAELARVKRNQRLVESRFPLTFREKWIEE